MKAAIFNPYLDSLGGGERYTLAVARALADKDYKVHVQWEDASIADKLKERFGISLDGIEFIKDIKRGDSYDVCFWVSDGSIPLLRARCNLLHFQVPFTQVDGKTLINRMKLIRINKVVANSHFTKRFIDREYGVKCEVVYPPVDTESFMPKVKKNMILFVGRFSQLVQSKNQDVLVKAFKKFTKEGYGDWKMVLAGGVEVGVGDYIKKLKRTVGLYNVEIEESPSFSTIKNLFGQAKLFWTASGYGVDEEKEPHKAEHFGISVVEAMSAGAVPLAYNAGGHVEIIKNEKDGFLWENINQLVRLSLKLAGDRKTLAEISDNSMRSSENFSYEKFYKNIIKLTL